LRRRNIFIFKVEGHGGRITYVIEKLCRQDRNGTVGLRIIQLGTLDHYGERKNLIDFQDEKSRS
jgi:hypothetical protein